MAKTRMTYIFNTDAACAYRLSYQDMAILDWIYTFALSKKMKSKTIYNPETRTSTTYYWVYYQALIDDFYYPEYDFTPLGITNRQVLARHIQSLCERGLLGFSVQSLLDPYDRGTVRGTFTMVSINYAAFNELTGTGNLELKAASVLGADGKPMNVKQYSAFKAKNEAKKKQKKMKEKLYSAASLADRLANRPLVNGKAGINGDEGKSFVSLYNTDKYNNILQNFKESELGTDMDSAPLYATPDSASIHSYPAEDDLQGQTSFKSGEKYTYGLDALCEKEDDDGEASELSYSEEITEEDSYDEEPLYENEDEQSKEDEGFDLHQSAPLQKENPVWPCKKSELAFTENPAEREKVKEDSKSRSSFLSQKLGSQPPVNPTVEPDIKTLEDRLFRNGEAEQQQGADESTKEWIRSYLGIKDIGISFSRINPYLVKYIADQATVFGLDDKKLLKGYIDYMVSRIQKRHGKVTSGPLILSVLAKQESFVHYKELLKNRQEGKAGNSPSPVDCYIRYSVCPVCGTRHEEGAKCPECGLELENDREDILYRSLLYKADKNLLKKYDDRLIKELSISALGFDFAAYRKKKDEIRRALLPEGKEEWCCGGE